AADHAEETAQRRGRADQPAKLDLVETKDALGVGRSPVSHGVAGEGNEAVSEDQADESRRAPREGEGGGIARPQGGSPTERRISAERNEGELGGIAGQLGQHRSEGGGNCGNGEVGGQRPGATPRGSHHGERRNKQRDLTEEAAPRVGIGRAGNPFAAAANRLTQRKHPARQKQTESGRASW